MSDGSIQVGDEVTWNWGGGHPKGKVVEVKTSGKLEIESKGKRVHKNADESNPAVHIERDGNDVVKRASELKRLRGGGDEETGGKESGQGSGRTTEESGVTAGPLQGAQPAKETKEKEATEKPAKGGKKGRKETTGATKKTTGGKRGRKKATTKEAAVGEKRKREEGEAKEGEKGKAPMATTEQEEGEREVGKEGKKAKIVHEGEQSAEPAGPPEKETITADADTEHRAAAEEAEKRISETANVEGSREETVEA